jgi:hypothetical protein
LVLRILEFEGGKLVGRRSYDEGAGDLLVLDAPIRFVGRHCKRLYRRWLPSGRQNNFPWRFERLADLFGRLPSCARGWGRLGRETDIRFGKTSGSHTLSLRLGGFPGFSKVFLQLFGHMLLERVLVFAPASLSSTSLWGYPLKPGMFLAETERSERGSPIKTRHFGHACMHACTPQQLAPLVGQTDVSIECFGRLE